ncbi:MAG: hypothetical protein QQW96_03870 [Tychonema bourrellyi B0820]|nr:hypothetical protein [Tychonema bourrellyi B0820]PJE45225.1 MAG: hypothetical protein CUR32_01085 [Flavobacterium sp.] [Flavobacterium sp. FEMGT703F]
MPTPTPTPTPTPAPTPEPQDISDELKDIWANMKALTGVAEVEKLMKAPQEWLMEQPLIKAFIEINKAGKEKGDYLFPWLDDYETVKMFPQLIGQCGIAFLETSHGINRAYNSKAHSDLAAAGESALAKVVSTSTEKGIYGDAINAFNESLNLPKLSKIGIKINQDMGEAWTSIEKKKLEAIKKAKELRDKYKSQLENPDVKLDERKTIRRKYNDVAKSLLSMGEKPVASPKKPKPTPKSKPSPSPSGGSGDKAPSNYLNSVLTDPRLGIIAQNPYDINSIYYDRISSIRSIKVNASALVVVPVVAPIVAVTGALVTAGVTAGIISSIASWFLGSCMNLLGMPATLIPALIHCVTAIVLKVSGSAGAEALRFFAASALKINKDLLMTVFGTSNMNATSWIFLTAMAVPILLVSIIIILAMRNKNKVTFSHFYLLAEHEKYPGFAYASIQNADDAMIEFDKMKKDLLALATVTYSDIHGVGINLEDKKPKVKGGFKLSTTVPSKMTADEANKVLEDFSKKHSVSIPLGAWKPI